MIPADTLGTTGFDYTGLPAEVADRQRARATRIASLKRRTVETMGEIGRELLEAQGELEHGAFLLWIEEATGLSKSTAYRFMDMARAFGSKLPTVGSLPPAVVQKLAAKTTPAPLREAVLRRIEAGETIKAETVLDDLREAKASARAEAAAEREEARRETLTPEQRAEEDALASRGAKRRAALDRKAEREWLEQRQRAERQEIEAMMVATRIVDRLGADEAAALFSQPSAALYQIITQTGRLAQIRRAHAVAPTEISAHAVSRTGPLSNFIRDPEAEAEAKAVADRIRDGEAPEPIIAVSDPDRRGRFDVIAGHVTYRALVDVLGQQMVPARVAPPVAASGAAVMIAADSVPSEPTP